MTTLNKGLNKTPLNNVPYGALRSGDILDIYFKECGQYPLLTLPEETELLTKYIKYRDDTDESSSLQRKKALEARELLINSNLRLVVKIAQSYRGMGLDLMDLIAEGNRGLMRSVEMFKLGKGAKLSTYAGFWIRQSLTKSLSNNSRTIRIPINLSQIKASIRKFREKHFSKHGSYPSDEVILKTFNITRKKLSSIANYDYTYTSLDRKVGGDEADDTTSLGSIIPDTAQKSPLEKASESSQFSVLRDALDDLKDREKAILELRFGLENKDYHTLEAIGNKFNLTRERIRQIEKVALKKLRFAMKNIDKIKG